MLLVDEVLQRSENEIRCSKTFHEDDFFVQGHFPGQPIVPGVILCECALQCGAILLASQKGEANDLPVATRMDSVKFKKLVRPGDVITIDVKLNEVVSTAYFLTGKITVDGKLAARLDFACTLVGQTQV